MVGVAAAAFRWRKLLRLAIFLFAILALFFLLSRIGWDKVDPANPAFRFANTYRVVSNLGVFDFGGPEHTMRAVSLHPGVTPGDVREATSFEVHGLDRAEETRLPTDDELRLIREVIDPKSLRDREIRS